MARDRQQMIASGNGPSVFARAQSLLAQGMSYREIVRTMDTSYNTVRWLLGKC